jgi:hypothetical protein
VDFGDGSEQIHVNLTDYINGTVSFRVNHSYPAVGTYTVTLNFTDNKIGVIEIKHNKTAERTVVVEQPKVKTVGIWDWWDYLSLGFFLSLPLLGVLLILVSWRRQKILERKGISYEEWQLRKAELAAELKKSTEK